MVKLEAIFRADSITPEKAAEIIACASRFQSKTEIEYGSTRVVLGSLIGVLSLAVTKNTSITVYAEGSDETDAALNIKQIIEV